jgi:hypothetical protein
MKRGLKEVGCKAHGCIGSGSVVLEDFGFSILKSRGFVPEAGLLCDFANRLERPEFRIYLTMPMAVCGTIQRSWLRHYAESLKLSVSIADEFIVFFNSSNPCCPNILLGFTQLLTETGIMNLSWG